MTEIGEHQPVTPPFEMHYPGLRSTIGEFTDTSTDVARKLEIETALDSNEYSDLMNEPTLETVKNGLNGGVVRKMSSINLAPGLTNKKEINLVVTETGSTTDEMIIATRDLNNQISGYTTTYVPENAGIIPSKYRQEIEGIPVRKETSYVDDKEDADRNTRTVAEGMMGTVLVMAERTLGRAPKDFTGTFTPEEVEQVDRTLAMTAITGIRDDESKYRESLDLAGFKNRGEFIEPDELVDDEGNQTSPDQHTYYAYSISLADTLTAVQKLNEPPTA